jgi:hypothetical protein
MLAFTHFVVADSDWITVAGIILFVLISAISSIAKKVTERNKKTAPRAPRPAAPRAPGPVPPRPMASAPRQPTTTPRPAAPRPVVVVSREQRPTIVVQRSRPALTPRATPVAPSAPPVERARVQKQPPPPAPVTTETATASAERPAPLTRDELRRAIILNELLQPPLALRARVF